jgi:hypothetical protein
VTVAALGGIQRLQRRPGWRHEEADQPDRQQRDPCEIGPSDRRSAGEELLEDQEPETERRIIGAMPR